MVDESSEKEKAKELFDEENKREKMQNYDSVRGVDMSENGLLD